MRKANWVLGAGVVFLVLLIALTVDPLGFFEGTPDDLPQDELGGDGMGSSGLKGRGTRPLPGADPRTWEGEPVGVLALGLGKTSLEGSVTGDGEPLRFARVQPVLAPPHHAVAVRTRFDGRWKIQGLPDGQHELRATATGFLGRTVVAPPVAGEESATVEPIDLAARPENRNAILVHVTDLFGRPLQGARVLATTAPWDLHLAMGPEMAGIPGVLHKSGTTDESGRVRLGPLQPEEYSLVAMAKGYVNGSVNRLVVASGRARSVLLRLAEGVSVHGRVLDMAGNGIEGAFVMGFAQPSFHSSLSTRSAADGSFVLDGLRKGGYMFVAASDDHGTAMTPGASPGRVDIKLAGTGRVKGRAVWEDGQPVTRGVVRPFKVGPFQYVYSQVFQLGADGSFDFRVPDGDWNCRVMTEEGFVSDGTMAKVVVGEETTVTVTVPKSAVVRGVVMDESGRHVEGAEVFVMQGGFPETPSREQYARSDADGRFEVRGLPATTLDLHVQHPEYANTKLTAQPAPADQAKEVSVRLKAGASVVGRVTDASGAPTVGEQVNLALGPFDFAARSTFTDGEGRYRFDAVTPGTYTVTTGPYEQGARGMQQAGNQVGESGVVTVDFRSPAAGGKVAGQVLQGGKPVAGAAVTVTDARGAERAVAARTDEDGRFSAEGIQFGIVRIEARTEAGNSGVRRITLAEGGEALDVSVLIGTCTVTARVLDTAGNPASGCWISLELAEGAEGDWSRVKDNGNSDSNGLYRSKGVQPGRYRLRVNRVEFAQFISTPFTLREGQHMNLGDIRMSAGAILQGVVRNDAGEPVEKVTVSLTDAQGRQVQMFSMATTGSDGRYAMHSVEPGRYTVHFQAKGHAPGEKAIEVTAEGASADGVLTRGGTVAVRVVDPGGAPVEGARIRLFDAKGREVTRTISLANFDSGRRYTGPDGRTSLADLASGSYLVRCEKQGFVVVGADARAVLEPGSVANVDITMEAQ